MAAYKSQDIKETIPMENNRSSIESLVERTRNYIETRIDLLKLKAIDKSSGFISVLITYLVVFVVFVLFFMLFNVALALLIGDLLGKSYYGFFIVAALYAVIGFILLKNREKWVKKPVINMMVKELID